MTGHELETGCIWSIQPILFNKYMVSDTRKIFLVCINLKTYLNSEGSAPWQVDHLKRLTQNQISNEASCK